MLVSLFLTIVSKWHADRCDYNDLITYLSYLSIATTAETMDAVLLRIPVHTFAAHCIEHTHEQRFSRAEAEGRQQDILWACWKVDIACVLALTLASQNPRPYAACPDASKRPQRNSSPLSAFLLHL